MEHELSTDDIRIPQLLLEVKVLEEQLYNQKESEMMKSNRTTWEEVTLLKNQMQSLELMYVLQLHPFSYFPSTFSSPPLFPSPFVCYSTL
jgi:hypothetical protein